MHLKAQVSQLQAQPPKARTCIIVELTLAGQQLMKLGRSFWGGRGRGPEAENRSHLPHLTTGNTMSEAGELESVFP